MPRENNVNIETRSLELTILLLRYYEHEAPISCNTTVYLAVFFTKKFHLVVLVQSSRASIENALFHVDLIVVATKCEGLNDMLELYLVNKINRYKS